MGKFPTSLIAIVILLMASLTFGVDATETRLAAYTVSTYECIGIYWKTAEAGECAVQFRQEGEERWREGLRLAYDPRDQEYRGSLVYLQPDTAYTIQLKTSSDSVTFPARTKSDHFPIGEITTLPGGVSAERLSITQSGTPEAYHLITPASGEKTTIDVMNTEENNVWIDADYVILRGLELKNAVMHGIAIARGRHDIVIEDCRVTFWGRMGGPISFGNAGSIDSAIYANRGAGNLTIQRNLLEYPRGASNDWDTGHPNGPQAISLINSSGGNVIRFNELRTTEDHGFNDGIGGGSNFSFEGSPNRDSDIYGNIIGNVWDDAIESEGANMNVRIWGNYIHHTYQHVALASTSKGPVYVFRNVFGVSRRTLAIQAALLIAAGLLIALGPGDLPRLDDGQVGIQRLQRAHQSQRLHAQQHLRLPGTAHFRAAGLHSQRLRLRSLHRFGSRHRAGKSRPPRRTGVCFLRDAGVLLRRLHHPDSMGQDLHSQGNRDHRHHRPGRLRTQPGDRRRGSHPQFQ